MKLLDYGEKHDIPVLLQKLRSPIDYGDKPIWLVWELLTQRKEAVEAIEQLLDELTKATKGEGDAQAT